MHCVLRSVQKFNFGTEGGSFLILCFKVRSFIRHVRNTEGRPFLSLFIRHVRNTEGGPFLSLFIRHVRNTEGGPFLMLSFEVRPVIRHYRNTEGRPFLMLRFEVRGFIRHVKKIPRADHFLAFSLGMLEIKRWDHYLSYVSRSAMS